MRERDIRRTLREICEELDQAARRVRKVVLPAVLGAGVALSGGCGQRSVPVASDGEPAKRQDQRAVIVDSGVRQPDLPLPQPMYMPAWPDLRVDQQRADQRRPDGQPAGAYGVPDPTPDYMAPMYAAPTPTPDAQ